MFVETKEEFDKIQQESDDDRPICCEGKNYEFTLHVMYGSERLAYYTHFECGHALIKGLCKAVDLKSKFLLIEDPAIRKQQYELIAEKFADKTSYYAIEFFSKSHFVYFIQCINCDKKFFIFWSNI